MRNRRYDTYVDPPKESCYSVLNNWDLAPASDIRIGDFIRSEDIWVEVSGFKVYGSQPRIFVDSDGKSIDSDAGDDGMVMLRK